MATYSGKHFDAVIIGAGISGLVCAAYLAKAGMKVLVVEQHDKPGGYCTSFKRKGFQFDAAAHSFGSYNRKGNFRKILNDLGANKIIKIKRLDPSDVIISPDFTISFWNETKQTISDLTKIFPNERESIKKFFHYLQFELGSHQFKIAELKDKTFGDLLNSFFSDKKLINTLSFPILGNGGLPPSLIHAFTGTKIFKEFLINGGYYPEGGMQKLPDALAFIVAADKSKVIYNKTVKKILQQNKTVTGVQLDSGETFFSKYVVSACDAMQTYKKFLGEQVVGRNYLKRLNNMTPSISTFILYMGIDKAFKGLPMAGSNIWYLPFYDLEQIYSYLRRCKFDKAAGFMLRVSPDRKAITAFFHAPFKSTLYWQRHKKRIADSFLRRIERFVPGIRKHLLHLEAASPNTLYRYTLNHKGADYGWEPSLPQLFNPDLTNQSNINRFYLTGHWTTQTHGIPGVAYLGHNTARLILKKEHII